MWTPAATLLGCTSQASVSAAADVTVTVACWAIITVPTVADIVLVWASVELSLLVATPFVSVCPDGGVRALLFPVTVTVSALFLIMLPCWSFVVSVIVLVAAVVGAAVMAGAA